MSSGPHDVQSLRCVLSIGSASTAGLRDENQDRLAHFESPFGHVFLLADGMGGYKGGAAAAALATARLPELLCALPTSMLPQDALVESIQQLNHVILEESRLLGSEAEGMGTTLVALLVRDTRDGSLAIGAHVGDSRIYFLRRERLFGLTRDHTVVRRLVDSGALTPEQALDHPQASVLTQALGRSQPVSVDITSWMQVQPDDVFLLCSDGLSGYAEDDAICEVLVREPSPQAAATELVSLAMREHSEDNISVLVVRADT